MDAAILQKEALQLPEWERALLADSLLASLSQPPAELETAWLREAEERMIAFRQGRIGSVDAGEALTELRARFPR